MTIVKRVLTALAVIFLVLFLINACMAFYHAQQADAATLARSGCPGGQVSKTFERFPGDKRHAPWRLAELDVRVHACFTAKGHFKNVGIDSGVHRNGTAEMLGYRYEMQPWKQTHNAGKLYGPLPPTTKVVSHTWRIYGTYRQCAPVPGGGIACSPDGNYHVKVTIYSKWMVKHDPYNGVKGMFDYGWTPDSGYAKDFMILYKTR